MTPRRMLADSLWPRSAGDAGNRRVFAASGPLRPRLSPPIVLPRSPSDCVVASGGAIADDGDLRVVHGDFLSRVALDGTVRWSLSLRPIALELEPPDEEEDEDEDEDEGAATEEREAYASHSLPTALAGGRTLVTVSRAALIVDANGEVAERGLLEEFTDDSGVSPNVTRAGVVLVTTPTGEVVAWETDATRELGWFGYDVVPPAIYADDSLVVAGYAGAGACRVRLSGEKVWKAEPRDADLLPTINAAQVCAVGSNNDQCSALISGEGAVMGHYREPAIFAQYHDMGWIAASAKRVARLDARGGEMWTADIAHELRWGVYGPIVDREGRVYVQDGDSLQVLAPGGARLASLRLGESAGAVFPAAGGVLAVVVDGALRLIGEAW